MAETRWQEVRNELPAFLFVNTESVRQDEEDFQDLSADAQFIRRIAARPFARRSILTLPSRCGRGLTSLSRRSVRNALE